jgi:hypothetical protein
MLVLLACFALAGYAGLLAAADSQWPRMLVWFAAAVIAHDLVLFPLYALADRFAIRLSQQIPQETAKTPPSPLNYLRVPVLGTGLLFLLFFPGIIRQGQEAYFNATGQTQQPFLGRWLLLTATMFAISAIIYTIRLGYARRNDL